jgi:hypothetical protein
MLKNLQQTFFLWGRAKTGVSAGLFVWLGLACCAIVFTFVYLSVAGYAWLSIKLGPVFGSLAMAGAFLLIAVIGAAAAVISRQRTMQRAILERAVRTRPTAALVDPRMLTAVRQAGRSFGWQRLVPLALLTFLTLQWAQQARREKERSEKALRPSTPERSRMSSATSLSAPSGYPSTAASSLRAPSSAGINSESLNR